MAATAGGRPVGGPSPRGREEREGTPSARMKREEWTRWPNAHDPGVITRTPGGPKLGDGPRRGWPVNLQQVPKVKERLENSSRRKETRDDEKNRHNPGSWTGLSHHKEHARETGWVSLGERHVGVLCGILATF